ncbi:MAG: hypothetical protein MUO63_11180 [Desulfobulbaceae bacterium]|nr:hypothetical protein [Desulfobulbaceae bacterium]
MIDIFIGKPPTMNRHMDDDPLPIQKTIRELIRIARNARLDRRKSTSDRRRQANDAYIINLSHRRELRTRLDRRQSQELLTEITRRRNQRKNRLDRRQSVNTGVHVKLSGKNDRRSGIDRRGDKPL